LATICNGLGVRFFFIVPIVLSSEWILQNISFYPFYQVTFSLPISQELPVYYINLANENDKRDRIENQLRNLGFDDRTRVEAWNSADIRGNVHLEITSVPIILNKNDNEIACIASHHWATYLAVTDTSNSFPYAMIIEDDVRFEFNDNERNDNESTERFWYFTVVR
jgi:GR25 family glycosyltransferase involved in LPS biosynthesis